MAQGDVLTKPMPLNKTQQILVYNKRFVFSGLATEPLPVRHVCLQWRHDRPQKQST